MTWATVKLTNPPSLQAIYEDLQDCHGDLSGELDASKTRLGTVSGAVPMSTNPVVSLIPDVYALRQSLMDMLQGGGQFVCIHPYIHPIGDRRGDYTYMTPQQATEAMADKLADPKDLLPSGDLQALFLLLRGVDNADFSEVLGSFNTIFPVTELQVAEHRAKSLATLEKDKLFQATGPMHPAWFEQDARRHHGATALDVSLGGLIGMAEGYALENTRPEAELEALIEKKRTHLEDLEDAWATMTEPLTTGRGMGLALAGNRESIHRQLTENLPAVEGYKLAALCCWIGEAEQMTFFRELLSL